MLNRRRGQVILLPLLVLPDMAVSNCSLPPTGTKDEDFRLPYLSHQQLPAGILPMMPEVAQAVGACQGLRARDYGRAAAVPNPANATVTAMIAGELLYTGASLTADAILANANKLGHLPLGPLLRPSEQLAYLASVQGLQVQPSSAFTLTYI